jgi:hypothetical protein
MAIKDNRDDDTIVVSDYLKTYKDGVVRTDTYYCTKMGEVRGTLAFHKNYMQYDAIPCPENEFLVTHFD